MSNTPRIGVRSVTQADIDYVCRTWFIQAKRFARDHMIPEDVYNTMQPDQITALVTNFHTLVAYDLESPVTVLGFVCGKAYTPLTLIHFIYVRNKFRRFHIAKALLDCLGHPEGAMLVGTTLPAHRGPVRRMVTYCPYYTDEKFYRSLKDGKSVSRFFDETREICAERQGHPNPKFGEERQAEEGGGGDRRGRRADGPLAVSRGAGDGEHARGGEVGGVLHGDGGGPVGEAEVGGGRQEASGAGGGDPDPDRELPAD